MLGVSLVGIFFGVSDWQGIASLPPDPSPTLFALDLAGALQAGMIVVILTFLIVDLFDTAGTLIGVAHQARLLDDNGRLPNMQKALIADSVGTVGGALIGTSPVTSYIESAAGASAGGRTGLTAVVVAILFLACLFFAPLAGSIPSYATAAAILYVACIMARPLVDVDWQDVTESRRRGSYRHFHPLDVLHCRRYRTRLFDLRGNQGDCRSLERVFANSDRGSTTFRSEIRLAVR